MVTTLSTPASLKCTRAMAALYGGPLMIDFECGQLAAGALERQTKPEARIAGGRADLNDVFGARGFRMQPPGEPVLYGNIEIRPMLLEDSIEHCEDSLLPLSLGQRRSRWIIPAQFAPLRVSSQAH